MARVERASIRELRRNASAVIAAVVAGETVIITDRGRAVAQMTPLPHSPYAQMLAAGLIRPATRRLRDLLAPEAGEPLSPALGSMRNDERY